MSDIENTESAEQQAPQNPFAKNPRLPADGGLSNLGLIMQLGASMLAVYNLLLMVLSLASPMLEGWGVALLLASLLGIIRNILHFSAGSALLAASTLAVKRMSDYLYISVVQTVLMVLLLGVLMPGIGLTIGAVLALMLMAWPAVVFWTVKRASVRELFARLSMGELEVRGPNQGIQGAGVLMTVMGTAGVTAGGLFVVTLLSKGTNRGGILGSFVIILILSLIVRSVMHSIAGVSALRGATPGEFFGRVRRYGVLAGVSIAVFAITSFAFAVETDFPGFLVQMVFFAQLLIAWPVIIYGFAKTREVTFVLDEDASKREVFDLAPDAGLSALGYVLMGSGVFGIAGSVGNLILAGGLFSFLPFPSQSAGGVTWWFVTLPAGLLSVWCGVQLVRMTIRLKTAALSYAVVMGGIAVWNLVTRLDALRRLGGFFTPHTLDYFMLVANVAIALVLPVAAVVLALSYHAPVSAEPVTTDLAES